MENRLGLSSKLILCCRVTWMLKVPWRILDQALAYKDRIVAVGLASAEVGNSSAKFTEPFARRDRRAF